MALDEETKMGRIRWQFKTGIDGRSGELAIFCPACPQVGLNIPVNWKEDPARQVIIF